MIFGFFTMFFVALHSFSNVIICSCFCMNLGFFIEDIKLEELFRSNSDLVFHFLKFKKNLFLRFSPFGHGLVISNLNQLKYLIHCVRLFNSSPSLLSEAIFCLERVAAPLYVLASLKACQGC
jgi:hypothetical protein